MTDDLSDLWEDFEHMPISQFHETIQRTVNEWKEWCEQEIAAGAFVLWSYNLRGGSTDNLISHITEGAD